eukprot:8773710-Pyramimonas_sp.AAC.3
MPPLAAHPNKKGERRLHATAGHETQMGTANFRGHLSSTIGPRKQSDIESTVEIQHCPGPCRGLAS